MKKKRNQDLEKIIIELFKARQHKLRIHHFYGPEVLIGLLGDTHYGSMYSNPDLVNAIYEIYAKEGVKHVYHTGDLVEGEHMYRSQEYEVYAHGYDKQLEDVVKNYPKCEGLVTHIISGNHDLSFWNSSGADIVKEASKARSDIDYLGQDEADIDVGNGVILKLLHPAGGTAYALSYFSQKAAESLPGEEKPNILAIGHFHKSEYIPGYRNIHIFQTGTLMSQSPYMRRKKLSAMIGGWMLRFHTQNKEVTRMNAEFIPFYK